MARGEMGIARVCRSVDRFVVSRVHDGRAAAAGGVLYDMGYTCILYVLHSV